MKSKAFDEFGKLFTKAARDTAIRQGNIRIDSILAGRQSQGEKKYRDFISSLTPKQINELRQLVPDIVDGTLHSLMFMFEEYPWIKIALQTEDETIADIREVAAGGLQGYVFIWAEEYSDQPLSHE